MNAGSMLELPKGLTSSLNCNLQICRPLDVQISGYAIAASDSNGKRFSIENNLMVKAAFAHEQRGYSDGESLCP